MWRKGTMSGIRVLLLAVLIVDLRIADSSKAASGAGAASLLSHFHCLSPVCLFWRTDIFVVLIFITVFRDDNFKFLSHFRESLQ